MTQHFISFNKYEPNQTSPLPPPNLIDQIYGKFESGKEEDCTLIGLEASATTAFVLGRDRPPA